MSISDTTCQYEFEEQNLKLFASKKDICETCKMYGNKNLSKADNTTQIKNKGNPGRELD